MKVQVLSKGLIRLRWHPDDAAEVAKIEDVCRRLYFKGYGRQRRTYYDKKRCAEFLYFSSSRAFS